MLNWKRQDLDFGFHCLVFNGVLWFITKIKYGQKDFINWFLKNIFINFEDINFFDQFISSKMLTLFIEKLNINVNLLVFHLDYYKFNTLIKFSLK